MQITTTLNRIKRFEDCEPVVHALPARLGKHYSGDEPIPFSTILDICGLAYAILCCRAEPQHYKVWYYYAVDCLNTVRHLMGSRSYDVLDAARCDYLGLATKLPKGNLKNRAFGAAHSAYLTALCKRMGQVSDDELNKACAQELVAVGVLALTQNKIDVAVEAVIEVAEPEKLKAIIKHFRRVVDAGWVPLILQNDAD